MNVTLCSVVENDRHPELDYFDVILVDGTNKGLETVIDEDGSEYLVQVTVNKDGYLSAEDALLAEHDAVLIQVSDMQARADDLGAYLSNIQRKLSTIRCA